MKYYMDIRDCSLKFRFPSKSVAIQIHCIDFIVIFFWTFFPYHFQDKCEAEASFFKGKQGRP